MIKHRKWKQSESIVHILWAWAARRLDWLSVVLVWISWWRHQMETFSALLALCVGNSPVPVKSPHKGQWRGALMCSLIYAWISDWVNNCEAGDLRRHRGHYDVNVMLPRISTMTSFNFKNVLFKTSIRSWCSIWWCVVSHHFFSRSRTNLHKYIYQAMIACLSQYIITDSSEGLAPQKHQAIT